ncbi:helix-turn-helix domain-containing protein [Exiguobacterium sp. SRB7LM]|uniref:helix-turn-helix domain-containing protein n=1 Tax=Exiguobacterium sp. SRB7LM TaxID=2608401 RepID=UPI0018C397EF|nr:helix-turn-helix domain-containing protein [Exiguobacterium sp. SRB7LM]MBG0918885.1 helix-turn-helix domain-containing protein [Exiguobacterium sp. SRB7LM]
MIGERIKALRKQKKMTQTQLAEGIVTKSMLSMIENGKAEASMRSLRELASRLDVSMQQLLTDPKEVELQSLVEKLEFEEMQLISLSDQKIREMLKPYLQEEMNSVWQGKAYMLYGDTYFQEGESERVLAYYERAIEIFEKLGESEELAMGRISQAYYLLMWNRYEESIERIEAIELLDAKYMKTKTRTEYAMLIVFKNLLCDEDLEGAIRQLEDVLEYMTRTRIYYRADDVYRTISICALYLNDEKKIHESLQKAKQYIQFTEDRLAEIKVALSEALYAMEYRHVKLLGKNIKLMESLTTDVEPFIAAISMAKGVYYAFRGETEMGRECLLALWKNRDEWKTHSLVDIAIYYEGLLRGTLNGCGDGWVPVIEEQVAEFPQGLFRKRLETLLQQIKG